MTTYPKISVPCRTENGKDIVREGEIVAQFGPFAAVRFEMLTGRCYSVTHVPTKLRCHTSHYDEFNDGFGAIECAREMHETFPNASEWTRDNSNGLLPKKSAIEAILEKHYA